MQWQGILLRDFSDADYDRWFSCMTPAQQQRVRALRCEADRRASVAGEALARELLSAQCTTPPERLEITRAPSGQPLAPQTGLFFSISHTRAAAFCAVSHAPVGMDAELLTRPVNYAVAARYFTADEQARLAAAPDPQRCFLELWTAKEALLKRSGCGLRGLKQADTTAFSAELHQMVWNGHLLCLCSTSAPPNPPTNLHFCKKP